MVVVDIRGRYGAGSLVLLFETELGMTNAEADSQFALWSGVCYVMPLLGGWIADSYLGEGGTRARGGARGRRTRTKQNKIIPAFSYLKSPREKRLQHLARRAATSVEPTPWYIGFALYHNSNSNVWAMDDQKHKNKKTGRYSIILFSL